MTRISIRSILHKRFLSANLSALSPHDAVHVLEDSCMADALSIMIDKKIGSLLVFDNTKSLSGIFTERDIITKLPPEPADCLKLPIKKFMSSPVITLGPKSGISRAIYEMVVGDFRHIVIYPANDNKYKIISARDIVNNIYSHISKSFVTEGTNFVDDTKVDEFLAGSLSGVALNKIVLVQPDAPIAEAVNAMKVNKVGCVLVAKDISSPRGIFTERDFLEKIACKSLPLSTFKLIDVMTITPETMFLNSTIAHAFERICEAGFRHIPVVNTDESLIGILSIRSILKALADNILADLS